MSRRHFAFLLIGSAAALASPVRADDCTGVTAAIDLIDAELMHIDEWVASTGMALITDLEQRAIELGNDLSTADDAVSDANINLTLASISVVSGLALAIVGPAVLGTGGLIVTGLFVSNALMVAKFSLAPASSADILETGVMRVVGDVERALSGLASEGGTVVAKGVGTVAGRFVSIGTLCYDFYGLVKAGSDQFEKALAAEAFREELGALLTELDDLKQPGNLRAIREDHLTTLRTLLEGYASDCDVDLVVS